MTTAAEGLQTARDLLVRKGWTQGAFYRGGKHCAVGALPENSAGAMDYLIRASIALYPERTRPSACPIVSLNDHPKTKLNDVLAVFDYAIVRAKEDDA